MNILDPNKERLWRQIEPKIKTDGLYCEQNRESLITAIRSLPDVDPKKNLWSILQKEITHLKLNPGSRKLYRYTRGVAATIILFVASFLLYDLLLQSETRDVIYASSEESVETFLAQICHAYPPKCNEIDFMELRYEILELNSEKSEVANSIFNNQTDEDIIKVNERINRQIVNLKTQIINYVD